MRALKHPHVALALAVRGSGHTRDRTCARSAKAPSNKGDRLSRAAPASAPASRCPSLPDTCPLNKSCPVASVPDVLGLSHPDTVATSLCTDAQSCGPQPGQNSRHALLAGTGARLTSTLCREPWAGVVAETEGVVRPSIMLALTQHNPRVCLEEDDVEALNVLYPDCHQPISTPICYKAEQHIGWVRLLLVTLVPVLAVWLCTMGLNGCVRRRQLRRVEQLEGMVATSNLNMRRRAARMTKQVLMDREREKQQRRRQVVPEQGQSPTVGASSGTSPPPPLPVRQSTLLNEGEIDRRINHLFLTRAHSSTCTGAAASSADAGGVRGAASADLLGQRAHNHLTHVQPQPRLHLGACAMPHRLDMTPGVPPVPAPVPVPTPSGGEPSAAIPADSRYVTVPPPTLHVGGYGAAYSGGAPYGSAQNHPSLPPHYWHASPTASARLPPLVTPPSERRLQ